MWGIGSSSRDWALGASQPRATRSQRIAIETLVLDSVSLVVPGDADYPLAVRVPVLGLSRVSTAAVQ